MRQIYISNRGTTELIMKTFIYVLSIEFLSLRRRPLSCETPLAARSEETWLYSQARRDLIKVGIFFSNGLVWRANSDQNGNRPKISFPLNRTEKRNYDRIIPDLDWLKRTGHLYHNPFRILPAISV